MTARGIRLSIVAACSACLPGGVGAAPSEVAPVRVVPLEGASVEAPFLSLGGDGLRLAGRAEPFPLDALREARFAPDGALAPLPEGGVGLRLVLRGDEVVRGVFVSGDERGVSVRPPGLSVVKIPFDAVRRIEAEPAGRGPCDEPARLHPPRPGLDVAYARSGDAHPGTLVGADAEGVTMENGGERRTLRWKDLVVLHIDEPPLPPAEGLVAELDTTAGTRLAATTIAGDATSLRVGTRSGLEVVVPREAVAVIRWRGGKFVYASDLPFTSKFTPYYADDLVDPTWIERLYGAPRADRTPWGCPLRLGGVPYRHGIAVHAKSAVTVPLGRRFTRFEARFGIDDEAAALAEGPRGDVTARVLVDGKEVWTSGGSVKGGEPPRTVGPIDVSGVESLVLEVDFGGEQHQRDRADWADPLLVRAP